LGSIEIETLSKTFSKRKSEDVVAVDRLDLTLAAGQVFGFLGPNGAGKTTTIKMTCGLVTPTSGSVRLNGYDIDSQRSEAMRQLGVVLEGTRSVYWRLTAWENLMYFGRLKGLRGREIKATAEWLLTELELWDRRNEPVREYSRGMQQKVAVARALIADPPIVLLDEPTLGLDVQSARTLKDWIRRLASERGKTVLLTTHQLDMAQELCDRVAIMNNGRLVADRPVGELLRLFSDEHYRIRFRGDVNVRLADVTGLKVEHIEDDTVISGAIADQDRLYDILDKTRSFGFPLVSVERAEPDLEEVFVKLLGDARP
jgi:ABC-2 type transport system ATP-binding protein